MSDILTQSNEWLNDDTDVAALVMRQWLKPVEEVAFGDEEKAVIFPPTYATPERVKEEDWTGYNIDRFEDKTSVCQLDSVGSQANRMEPIFKRKEYKSLVPEVIIQTNNGPINLLNAGHRAADAIVRFTFGPGSPDEGQEGEAESLGQQLWDAYEAWNKYGDAEKLARIAPTSIVFGSWDSRATQAKLPRIVRSVIRAYDVKVLHRSAQYATIAGEILEGGDAEVTTKGPKAELGLAHVPAVKTHGGIEVHGNIRRDAMINLVAIRALGVSSDTNGDVLRLRRYILGLALVALTARQGSCLREGCHLVQDPAKPPQWSFVRHDGSKGVPPTLDDDSVKAFALAAADEFGVKTGTITATFDPDLANAVLGIKDSKVRKKLLRQGPVTKGTVAQLTGGNGPAWNTMNKDELKAECERRGLATDGTKKVLVDRLQESEVAAQQDDASGTEADS